MRLNVGWRVPKCLCVCDGTVLRQVGEVPQGAADSQTPEDGKQGGCLCVWCVSKIARWIVEGVTFETPPFCTKVVSMNSSSLTSTITQCHQQRSCSETLVTGGILSMEIPSTQPTPRSTLCRVTNVKCASAALYAVNACAPALESPAVSVRMRRTWRHVRHVHAPDAQLSPLTLCLCLLRHNVHI